MRKNFVTVMGLSLILPAIVVAQTVVIDDPLGGQTFETIIDNLIGFIFRIGIVLAPLMIIVGGFLFVTAGGNLEQVKQAKKIIIWTIVGFLIVLLAQGIMSLIEQILGI